MDIGSGSPGFQESNINGKRCATSYVHAVAMLYRTIPYMSCLSLLLLPIASYDAIPESEDTFYPSCDVCMSMYDHNIINYKPSFFHGKNTKCQERPVSQYLQMPQ